MRVFKVNNVKRVWGLHFTPDGKRLLAVAGDDETFVDRAFMIDLASGTTLEHIDPESFYTAYAVDPNVTRLLVSGSALDVEGSVCWRGLSVGDEWQALESASADEVTGLAFDPTGTILALATDRELPPRRGESYGRTAHSIEFRRFDAPGTLGTASPTDEAQLIAFNPDATRIAAVDRTGMSIEIFDIKTGWRVSSFELPNMGIQCLRYLADGRLAVASAKTVYVMPVQGSEPDFVLTGQKKMVTGVAATPDGKRLVTSARDGTICTWASDTGKLLETFTWEIGGISAVAVSPDGLTCVAAGTADRIVVWDVDS